MVGVTGDLFLNVGLVVIVAGIAAYLLRLLKQPQILAYVLVGILLTPVLGLVTDTSVIDSMAIIGIAFLLFIVGLEMDLKALKNVSLISTLGGSLQIILLFLAGYLFSVILGLLPIEAAYMGLILAFSSTMVVMKLLSDKRELNTLHGRIVIGILLVQDIVAILALSLIPTIGDFSGLVLLAAVMKFLFMFGIAYLASKYLFPRVFKFAARNQELLLVSALTVCFLFALAFYYLGFSVAIGAFLAGLALGNLDYNLQIIGKVKSLKDFFALLFFVALGMKLSLSALQQLWLPALILLLVVMLLKPILVMFVCSLFRYTKKTSFLTANALAQVGEFSLIVATLGVDLGHLSSEIFSLVVVITLVSITLTSYYIQNSSWFYKLLQKPLSFFSLFSTEKLEYLPSEVKPKVVLCGHNRIGYSILKKLQKDKKKVLVVDYNPEIINQVVKQGFHCIYGEVTDDEIIERMHLPTVTMLISTVPSLQENLHLIREVRKVNKRAKIIVTALIVEEALRLYKAGADYVILPHFLGGEHVAGLISKIRKKRIKMRQHKVKHIAHLQERQALGHDHPNHNA